MILQCPLCQRVLSERRGFSNHIGTHKDLSEIEKEKIVVCAIYGETEVKKTIKDYSEEKYCIYNLPINIAKYIKLLGIKRSSKEERSTERYKNKYLSSIQEKYGSHITNISQVEEVQLKKIDTYTKNSGSYDEYLKNHRKLMNEGYESYIGSDKHISAIKNIEATCLKRYGYKNFGAGDCAKSKRMKSHRRTIDSWDYEEKLARTSKMREAICSRGGYSSNPEKRVRKALIDLDILFDSNKHIWNYNWDMVFGKVIIEVQGTMWHAKPDRYKENDLIMGKILVKDIWKKDKRKKDKAISEGYILIEIWEDEINKYKTDEELCEFVKKRINENGILL